MQNDAVDSNKQIEKLENQHQEVILLREEARQHLLHAETVTMMTKYQVVFEKLQSALEGLNRVHEERTGKSAIRNAFSKLRENSQIKEMASVYNRKLMARRFAVTLERAFRKAKMCHKVKLQEGFQKWRHCTMIAAIEASEDSSLKEQIEHEKFKQAELQREIVRAD